MGDLTWGIVVLAEITQLALFAWLSRKMWLKQEGRQREQMRHLLTQHDRMVGALTRAEIKTSRLLQELWRETGGQNGGEDIMASHEGGGDVPEATPRIHHEKA